MDEFKFLLSTTYFDFLARQSQSAYVSYSNHLASDICRQLFMNFPHFGHYLKFLESSLTNCFFVNNIRIDKIQFKLYFEVSDYRVLSFQSYVP